MTEISGGSESRIRTSINEAINNVSAEITVVDEKVTKLAESCDVRFEEIQAEMERLRRMKENA